MTPIQADRIRALARVSMLPGSPDKRFVRAMGRRLDIAPEKVLTTAQDAYLERLTYRYRRQIGRKEIIPQNGG